jgi:spore coat protein U-like protein
MCSRSLTVETNGAIMKAKSKSKFLVVAVFASAWAGTSAQAETLAGTVNATLTLTSGCAVDSGGGSIGNTTWGTLDFGTQPAGFTGSLYTQATGSAGGAPARITCSPDITSLDVTVDGGQHANEGMSIGSGSRAMASNSARVPYDVYVDDAHSRTYVAGASQTFSVPSAGSAFDIPIYGVANKTSTSALPAGTYTDVLNVTLAW